jgi:Multiubiquitin
MSTGNEAPNAAVRIHIDRQPYECASPTTGDHLYKLASIPPHRELFREVGGDREDEPIPRGGEEIRLHEDEHFYSAKEIILIVNAQKRPWAETTISYEQVTHLAYPEPAPPGVIITYTVEYERGPHRNREGSLTPGHSVYVKNRMIFVVTETGRS